MPTRTPSRTSAAEQEDNSPGSVYLVSGDGHLLSLPIPSSSPHDPLGWSLLKRCRIISLITAMAAIGVAVQQFPSLIVRALIKEMGEATWGPFTMNHVDAVPTLFMGIGCLIWTPMSLWLGRRPVLILCAGLMPVATLLSGMSTSFAMYIISIALLGLANGVAFSTGLLVLIDVTFIHQRSNAIAADWGVATFITQLLISLVPLTNDVSTYWRPIYRAWAVPSAVLFVLVWLFVPETYFLRPPVALDGRILVQGGSEKVRMYDDWDQVPGGRPAAPEDAVYGGGSKRGSSDGSGDDEYGLGVSVATAAMAEPTTPGRAAVALTLVRSPSHNGSLAVTRSPSHAGSFASLTPLTPTPLMPSLARNAQLRGPSGGGNRYSAPSWAERHMSVHKAAGGDWRSALAFFPQTGLCLVNPLLFWVALLNAVNFAGMVSIGSTYPAVLMAPPYSLEPRSVSLVNLAAALGSLLAWPGSGLVIERLTNRLTRRKGRGVRHAEYYLLGFALPVSTGVLSLVLYGLAVRHGWHPACIYASYGLNSFSYASGGVANTVWAAAVFPRWAAAALAVVGGVTYVLSFGLSFAIPPWIASQGFAGANLQIAAIVLVLGLVAVPVAFWGRNVRQFIHSRWGAYEAGAVRPQ
ncbi:hypothetical protein GGTG_09316 [Gaeumannomyces tritici R3-111a-1]|uniref:Major facilitator superfamily (MFS) profile domain-containing protein n=1 Tax=Gaeumannomyces tritici (strain R3-111a-1) TaxID=644352 RepID=J3P719_GAET3|nr:hypothetical protein GGTG_09316 [Gaeumannomyces tritici R3-111a-1]EJT72450.1 hypothetical protein GGTG_09316 [Gaeumannomyces tritici R3-111a-1]